jgi:hypothetical protein
MEKITIKIGNEYSLDDIPLVYQDALMACHHQGQCDSDVESAKEFFAVNDQDKLRQYLSEFGAWNDKELADNDANLGRMLWLMAGYIQEQGEWLVGMPFNNSWIGLFHADNVTSDHLPEDFFEVEPIINQEV